MIEYYIVVDEIIDINNIKSRLYKFNPELSLKPIRVNKDCYISMEAIIDTIENSLCRQDNCKFYILGNDLFLRNMFDNDIMMFTHIEIEYHKSIGYRVLYRTYDCNIDSIVIELLDVSTCGIFKYIRKLKNGY